MQIAIIGCGYVADLYMNTLPYHPNLQIIGVYDHQMERAQQFSDHYGLSLYQSQAALLADPKVEIVVNLTNPKSHFAVSKACLEAGKHVYSEKPLAMDFAEAQQLVDLAKERGLYISAAPCSLLSETAQTLWKAIREEVIGKPRLVYAELDDGLIHRMNHREWLSTTGSPWPHVDEFETGCTVEHAGYYLSWLTAFFGPAERVTAFSTVIFPDKQADTDTVIETPDLSIGCIEFKSGVVARITCSIAADHNHDLTIIGELGSLSINECWDYHAPVFKKKTKLNKRVETIPVISKLLGYGKQKLPLVQNSNPKHGQKKPLETMDFFRGVDELAEAITAGRPCRLSAEHALHITEITLTLQHPQAMGSPRNLQSTFEPIAPMPWAENTDITASEQCPIEAKATQNDWNVNGAKSYQDSILEEAK